MTSSDLIKQLREQTGAGIVDVQQALTQADGDAVKALELLRIKGQHVALKKADRAAHEGCIGSYVHSNGKIAALVALVCETDFVARNAAFRDLAHDLALQVAAMRPAYRAPDDVPPDVLEHERNIVRQQMADAHKPASVLENILAGKLEKFYREHCLLRQPFVKDDTKTIADLLTEATAKLGEKIEVRTFTLLALSP